MPERLTVFGSSRFLGRRIVRHLAAGGAEVRIAVRRPERADPRPFGRAGQIRRSTPTSGTQRRSRRAGRLRCRSQHRRSLRRARGVSFEAIHARGTARRRWRETPACAASCTALGIGADAVRLRPTCARVRPASVWCAQRSPGAIHPPPASMFGQVISSNAWPASFGSCRQCHCSAGARSGCSRSTWRTSRRPWPRRSPRRNGREAYELGGPRVYTYKALVQLVVDRTGAQASAATGAL